MQVRGIRWGAFGRKLAGAVGGVLVLAAVLAWLSGVFEPKIEPATIEASVTSLPADARTDEVHEVEKEYIEEAIGTLKAASRSVVSAKILATIESVNVSAGDMVAAGDVLVQLDMEEFTARLRQSEAMLSSAESTRNEATQTFDRAERLLPSRQISQQEYDQARRNLEVAQAEERRAQQAIHEAEVALSYTTIRIPRRAVLSIVWRNRVRRPVRASLY